ncbi:MAG: hypothetical protein QM831_05450 [Kofleriaceae bacterium]
MKALIAIAAVLVIGGVALVLIMSSSDPDKAPAAKPKSDRVVADNGTPETKGTGPGGAPTVAPSLDTGKTGSDAYTEYMIGDIKVRDHRKGSNAPLTVPPNPHPANARELPLELTHDITSQVNKAIYACSASVPKEARGDKPKAVGQLVVSVKNHQLTVTNLTVETRDITDEEAAKALVACSQEKTAALTANAKDVDDIDGYKIQLNYALP